MITGGPPILVVDDDEAILDVLGGQVTLAGYEVHATTSAREALEGLRRTRYAAIISDYKMPEMCGLDLLASAREIQPAATRILVTGVLSLDTMTGAIESGLLHRFIAKPWARAELLAAVEAAVQHHWLVEENQRLKNEIRRLSDALTAASAKVEVLLDQSVRRESAIEADTAPVREIEPAEMRPGMRVARAVSSPSGLTLLEPGDELTPSAIDQLKGLAAAPSPARRLLIYERLTA
jgi:DNA-binding NtrC family response regulator